MQIVSGIVIGDCGGCAVEITPPFVVRAYPELDVGGFSRVDGTVQFYNRINALLKPDMAVLDFGAGRGEWLYGGGAPYRTALRSLKGKVAKVIGLDIDPIVMTNPSLDEAMILADDVVPLQDHSVDLVIADHVFEHLATPEISAAELDRILKPGGWICVRTPNKYGFVALANQIVPDTMKARIIGVVQPNRAEEDVFPAHYRLNTKWALRRYFPTYQRAVYFWNPEPSYHGGNLAIFAAMRTWQAIIPPVLGTVLIAFLRKPKED
jgi:SAM-dependent methyltransferase